MVFLHPAIFTSAFQGPIFSGSRFFWVQVFQGLGAGYRSVVRIQVLEVAINLSIAKLFLSCSSLSNKTSAELLSANVMTIVSSFPLSSSKITELVVRGLSFHNFFLQTTNIYTLFLLKLDPRLAVFKIFIIFRISCSYIVLIFSHFFTFFIIQ